MLQINMKMIFADIQMEVTIQICFFFNRIGNGFSFSNKA